MVFGRLSSVLWLCEGTGWTLREFGSVVLVGEGDFLSRISHVSDVGGERNEEGGLGFSIRG